MRPPKRSRDSNTTRRGLGENGFALALLVVGLMGSAVHGKSGSNKNIKGVGFRNNNNNPLETLHSRLREGIRRPPLTNQHRPTKLTGYGSRRKTRESKVQNDAFRLSNASNTILLSPYNETTSDGDVVEGLIVRCIDSDEDRSTTETKEVRILPQTRQESLRLDAFQYSPSTATNTSKNNHAKGTQDAIPVEGLFGIYSLPSGQLWVWISKSRAVYSAPPTTTNPQNDQSWWQIRKVEKMHLSFLPSLAEDDASTTSVSRVQNQEEKRQLILLRQALKEHDWYFCPTASKLRKDASRIVPDMTRNLQHCFKHYESTLQSPENAEDQYWWEESQPVDSDNAGDNTPEDEPRRSNNPLYPDSRFFWNEGVLEPLMDHYRHHSDEHGGDTSDSVELSNLSQMASQWLLEMSIPVTSAFVGVQESLHINATSTTTNKKKSKSTQPGVTYDQLLVSRRSRWRAGTRFTKRGADASGNVANYAETEQVLFVLNKENQDKQRSCDHVCSHVQTRGSIPLRWSSPTDIKTYRPRVRIGTDPLAQARAMRQHLIDQTSRYVLNAAAEGADERKHPGLVLVNLVDKKSDQGRLGRAMDSVLLAVLDVYENYQQDQEVPSPANESEESKTTSDSMVKSEEPATPEPLLNSKTIKHEWFDFHAEVKGGRWDRLKSLLTDIQPSLKEQSFFGTKYDADQERWNIERLQTGVVRTNCMDCLDRTNVVQSLFGRQILFAQLKSSSLLSTSMAKSFRLNPLSLPWDSGEVSHRSLWADNADAISRLYAGTPALKGDFTRTGKRTKKGALDDGVNSIQRYYLNNFLDADRQEGIDLLTQHQDFVELGAEDDSDGDLFNTASPKQSAGSGGLSIQEAARQLLMGGTWGSLVEGAAKDDDDESNYARAKVDTNRGGAFSIRKKRKPSLNLLWLPGDLQEQVRSLASLTENDDDDLPLKSMDERSASDLPWWVVADDSSEDDRSSDTDVGTKDLDVDDESTNDVAGSTSGETIMELVDTNHGGYIVAALVAATKAPLATAALVLGITSFSLASAVSEDDEEYVL